MFAKVLLCSALILSCNSNSQNYLFSANNWNSEFRCVTNSSFALSWVDEDVNKPLSQVSNFIPKKQGNNFDCNISNDTRTLIYYIKDPWILKKSSKGLILDHRWEEMKVILSDHDTLYEKPLRFKQILSDLENDFEIPFSVRTEKEAHIFICDGPHPPKSNCYWFMLHAFDGAESAIRKCTKNMIPASNDYFAQPPCSTKLTKIEHPNFPPFLSNKYWSHFKLIKKASNFSLVKVEKNSRKVILELVDSGKSFNLTHLTVYSRRTSALWKFHSLDYIYTNKQTDRIDLGPSIKPSEGLICVSMFVSMCSFCKLKLSLASENQVIEEKMFESIQFMEWSQIQFLVEKLDDKKYILLVSTLGLTADRFWAIDYVRQCQKKEFRMLALNTKAPCQLLSEENNVVSSQNKLEVFGNSCPEDTIGELCVPCSWVFEQCQRIKICSRSGCFCSAGFDYKECFYNCKPGYYGHGCQKKCQNCAKTCDSVNGTCPICSSNYSGPKCEIAPAAIFAKPPVIVNVNFTKAKLSITNFEVLNVTRDDPPSTYSLEIKEIDGSDQNWTSVGSDYPFYVNRTFDVIFLKADTTYAIRSVVTTRRKKSYPDRRISYTLFTTKCQDISENNIKTTPTNTSVNVSLIQISGLECKINKYVIKIEKLNTVNKSRKKYIIFENLKPFTNYTIEFQSNSGKYQKTFQTLESEPENIQNLTVNNVSLTSCTLQWQQPSSFNGEFRFYVIEIQHQSHLACGFQPHNSSQRSVINVENTTAVINDLMPFSAYVFTICAVNTRFSGQKKIITISTKPSNVISNDEIPSMAKIVAETHTAEVTLSQIRCTKIRGPVLVKTTATCRSQWCSDLTSITLYNLTTHGTLQYLKPFTDYNLKIEFCRNENCSGYIINTKFTTKPAAPDRIKNLSVFSKNATTIWLKWQPSYPPNGVLKNYKFEVSYYNNLLKRKFENSIVVNGTNCKLWPNYHCAILKNLKPDEQYTLTITGRNEESPYYGKSVSIVATTKVEPSEAPRDLKISWSFANDLELEWKHPDQTNGQIQFFRIKIEAVALGISIEKKLLVTEESYNSTYFYTVKMKNLLLPATLYKIKIVAFNGFEGNEILKSDTSPPEIPSLVQTPQFWSSNNIIKIEIFPREPQEAAKIEYKLFLNFSDKTVARCNITKFETFSMVIGDGEQLPNCDQEIKTLPLDSGTVYNITIRLKNNFLDKIREKTYSFSYHTTGLSSLHKYYLFGSLIFLIVILMMILVFLFLKRKKLAKISKTEEMLLNQTPVVTYKKKKDEIILTDKSNFSKIVNVSRFELYAKESEHNSEFQRQHAVILKNPIRTIYETTEGSQYFDYVDMEFVDGSTIAKAYIASITPNKPKRISDFWKIIWEDNVRNLILTGEIEHQYWPKNNMKMHCYDLTVQLAFTKNFPTYNYRKFILVQDDEIKHVEQIQSIYFGQSPEKFVPIFKRMLKLSLDSFSPILVHSVDLREAGFLLLCDMCLRMAEKENVVDVFGNLHRLSNYKAELVDNLGHYRLAHSVISACLFAEKSEDNLNNIYVNL